MKFYEQLTILRKNKGWSQEQLAEAMGLSRQAVSKWETGESKPDIDKLLLLSDVFSVSMDVLCGREEQNKDEGQQAIVPAKSALTKKRVFIIAIFMAVCMVSGFLIGYFIPRKQENRSKTNIENISISTLEHNIVGSANRDSVPFRFTIIPDLANEEIQLNILCVATDSGSTVIYPAVRKDGLFIAEISLSNKHSYILSAMFVCEDQNITRSMIKISNIDANSYSFEELWK